MSVPVFRLVAKVRVDMMMFATVVMMWMNVNGKASRNQAES